MNPDVPKRMLNGERLGSRHGSSRGAQRKHVEVLQVAQRLVERLEPEHSLAGAEINGGGVPRIRIEEFFSSPRSLKAECGGGVSYDLHSPQARQHVVLTDTRERRIQSERIDGRQLDGRERLRDHPKEESVESV